MYVFLFFVRLWCGRAGGRGGEGARKSKKIEEYVFKIKTEEKAINIKMEVKAIKIKTEEKAIKIKMEEKGKLMEEKGTFSPIVNFTLQLNS